MLTYEGQSSTVKQLLQAGVDLNKPDRLGHTRLQVAAAAGHTEIVKDLLKAGVEVDALSYGMTPLYGAACNGHAEIVKALLDAGAEVDTYDAFGYTPLHGAIRISHAETIQCLLLAGAASHVSGRSEEDDLDVIMHGQTRQEMKAVRTNIKATMTQQWKLLDMSPNRIAQFLKGLSCSLAFRNAIKTTPSLPNNPALKELRQFLLMLTDEQHRVMKIMGIEKLPGKMIEIFGELIKGGPTVEDELLNNIKKLPNELIIMIRKHILHKAFVRTLIIFYDLKPSLANMLFSDSQDNAWGAAFCEEKFLHNWQKPWSSLALAEKDEEISISRLALG